MKLTYTTKKIARGYVTTCNEVPSIKYGPKELRETAQSGARRAGKKWLLTNAGQAPGGFTASTGPSKVAPASFLAPKPIVKEKVNHICLVIDRSGSMSGLSSSAVKALNANVETIRQQSRANGQKSLVSVIAFDDTIDVIRRGQNAELFEPVRENEVRPRGNTALFDATAEAILLLKMEAMSPAMQGKDVSFLVISITDGAENGSRRYNSFSLKNMIDEVTRTDLWTISFLVPQGTKQALLYRIPGFPEGNVAEWELSDRGIQEYQAKNAQAFSNYSAARSKGTNSSTTFYTNLSGLTAKDVKKNLDDLSGQVRILQVDREMAIKDFVEAKLGTYTPGTCYYQLSKDEKKIQGYKQLFVMEKGKKTVYGGDDARSVLGIPNGTLRVKPGNHGNFDIFVQSNSLNRKLVRGTALIVDLRIGAGALQQAAIAQSKRTF